MSAPDLSRTTGSPLGWSVRLSLFYAAIFLVAGVSMPWFPVYLQSRGLSADQIGLILAIGFWVKPLANPVGSRWADLSGERRRPLIVFLIGAGAAYALFAAGDAFWAFFLAAVLASCFNSPILPLADNLTMTAAAERNLDYGRVRLWGSVTFIGAVYAAGWLLEGAAPSIILWLMVGGYWLTAIVAANLPDIRFPKPQFRRRNPFALIGHPVFALFLLASGLNSAAHAVLYGFGSIHWRAVGLDDVQIGILWAIGVVAEIVLFWLSRRIVGRTGPLRLMLAGCAAGLLRWTLTAGAEDFAGLALLQVLHALTFGAAHLGAMHFIQRAAPEGMSATAQGLFSAFGMGLFMGFGALAAGFLYDGLGGSAYYVMAIVSAVSTLAALLLIRRWDGSRLTLG
ncbi:MAG: MFS transporter [Minwuia sp.]|uniref:MFS transporter n=1 Tax=Minwuia sp. TaxID=2493630 RepID=UPI003A89DE0D